MSATFVTGSDLAFYPSPSGPEGAEPNAVLTLSNPAGGSSGMTITGAGTGDAPTLATVGTDLNVNLALVSKGASSHISLNGLLVLPTGELGAGASAYTQDAGDNSTLLATDQFVTTAIANAAVGKPPVQLATTAALPAGSYSGGVFTVTATGTLTVDGTLTALGNRILVKNQATQAQNGIYTVTTAGASGVHAVLTLAADFTTGAQFPGATTYVEGGTRNGGSWWAVSGPGPFTVGSTAVVWLPTGGNMVNQFNVLLYGADPSGHLSSAGAFNAAIAAAQANPNGIMGAIYVPAGTYTIDAPLSELHNCAIRGDGSQSELQFSNQGSGNYTGLYLDVGGVFIRDLALTFVDGSADFAIYCAGGSPGGSVEISGCTFSSGSSMACLNVSPSGDGEGYVWIHNNNWIEWTHTSSYLIVVVNGQTTISDNSFNNCTCTNLIQTAAGALVQVHRNQANAVGGSIYVHGLLVTSGTTVIAAANDFSSASGTAISGALGAHSSLRDNAGYNPVGYLSSQPSVPSSGSVLTNSTGVDWDVWITALGGLTAVAVGGTAVGVTPVAGMMFPVPANQTITFTYTVTAPTIAVFGH